MSLTPEFPNIDQNPADRIVEIRRRLHRCPEMPFREFKTAAIIAAELDRLGISYQSGVAATGIIADISGNASGPTVAIRADMDGLALTEKTGLPFASIHTGMMHACGHDGHMAILLGTAAILKNTAMPGNVRLIFQPAEEDGGGARVMIKAGALDGIDCIIGGHIDRHYDSGEIIAADGLVCAYADEFSIEIKGPGGHAARPHETADTVVAAASLVMNLQTLVSRETDPGRAGVISVGEINGGSAANVIADRVVMRGTIRATHPGTRKKLHQGIRRMTGAMAEMFPVRADIRINEGYPPIINDKKVAGIIRDMILQQPKNYRLRELEYPSLGGEDFSFYLRKVPGCFLRIGARPTHRTPAPAHSPGFDFNEDVLLPGAALFARAALAIMMAK